MAETQEKKTGDSAPNNMNNDASKNQTGNTGQNNMPADMSGAKNSTDQQNNKSGNASSVEIPGAADIYKQAKETAGQAYGKVTEQASSQIVTQKDNLARGLGSVADGIRQMGESLRGGEQKTPIADVAAKYGDSLANQVEQVSNYLEKKDLRELVRDIEVFARRNPAVFIGGAFALGVAAARFLKSSNPNQALMRRPSRKREGIYIPDRSEGVYLPEDLSKKVGLADSSVTSSTNASKTDDKTSTNAFSPNKGG